MEKTYTKAGYSYIDKTENKKEITREIVEKSIVAQTKLRDNLNKNLLNLQADLEAIDKATA